MKTKYIVELTDKHVDGGATCVEEQVDSVKKEKTEVVFTLNVQEEVDRLNKLQRDLEDDLEDSLEDNLEDNLEDDEVGIEEMVIEKSIKMNLLMQKFGEEESQGSGRKKVPMRKVIVPAKRGQRLKGPRAIVTRIDDFLYNFHVEGGKRKSIEDENEEVGASKRCKR